ncbi:hypothetical protein KAW65_00160 [candidate division WOR-3 bacterium]|nr:hypothetical protein [candidate division WOR-3 bacterium]
MVEYMACMRSNSFKVKNIEAFKKAIEDEKILMNDIEVIEEGGEVILAGYSFIPFNCGPDEGYEDFEFAKFIQEHLVRGEKAVIMEIGHEKLCYLNAFQYVITPEKIEEKSMTVPEGA